MADGHEICGSAKTRNMSRNLADSLIKVSESCNLSNVGEVLDVSLSQTVGDDAVEREFFEDLGTKLATISGEVLVHNLSKNYSIQRLTKLREYAANLCREERTNCPKGRLVRRLSRQSGPKVEFKLATDILELVRYWKSGEENQQLSEIFVKSNESLSTNRIKSPSVTGNEQLELSCYMEKLESKLMAVTVECSASVNAMKKEINELRNAVELRDSKIQSLEAEIAGLKGRCKVNNERLTENVKENAFELSLAKGKLQNAEQSLANLSKGFDQIKKNLHTGRTKRAENEPLGEASAKSICIKSAMNASELLNDILNVNESTNTNVNNKEKSKQTEQSNDTISVDDYVNSAESSENTTSSTKILTPKVVDKEFKEDSLAERDTSEIEFVGVQRKVVKRVFLGGIKEGVTIEKITQYMKDKGIEPTFVRLMHSKRKGTTSARVNVHVKDFDTVKVSMFWPEGVRARPWLS